MNISNDDQQISGIFIKNIIPSSPAELSKQLKVNGCVWILRFWKCLKLNILFESRKVGDRILSVNGEDVRNATQEYAIHLVKNAGDCIVLEMQSFDIIVSRNYCSIIIYVRLILYFLLFYSEANEKGTDSQW